MQKSDHHFDWQGFFLMSKIILVAVVASTVSYQGFFFWYNKQDHQKAVYAPTLLSHITDHSESIALATSTPIRIINKTSIADAVPAEGKFVAADLVHMKLFLFTDGTTTAEYPILTKGKPGSPYETPSGMYTILTKESDHLNRAEKVHMPYSMEFYGNYFIHGWPVYTNGTPVASTYSGGCIRLSTADAAKVYAFVTPGTKVFVYDTKPTELFATLSLKTTPLPKLSTDSYLVADVDTGDVYAEQNANIIQPITSLTKLMTALVANETIMFDRKIDVPSSVLGDTTAATNTRPKTFVVGDLLYPLIMQSNSGIADSLSRYYDANTFVHWMNTSAKALDMASTTFADATGNSPKNLSTPDDLYHLSTYLANKKSFIWNITRTPTKTLTAEDGSQYTIANLNTLPNTSSFVATNATGTTATSSRASLFEFVIAGQTRRVAIITIDSASSTLDTQALAQWFAKSVVTKQKNTACVNCAVTSSYRKIEL